MSSEVFFLPFFFAVMFFFKAGVNMKTVFWLVITALTQISRLRFKQSRISMLIPEIYVLGRSVDFLVI